jgi:hypothetical protein
MQQSTKALIEISQGLRKGTLDIGKQVRAMMDMPVIDHPASNVSDPSEVRANIMLAYRHLEDARMRLGKVIQAADGGVSVYDK